MKAQTQPNLFQKGVLFSGIQTYIHLLLTIKLLSHDVRRVRRALKRFVQSTSFYSFEEYFDSNWKWVMLYLFVNHISIFAKWYAKLNTLDFVSLYFNFIESYYCILFFIDKNFLFNFIYIYIHTTLYLLCFLLLLIWLFPYIVRRFTEK